VEGLLLLLLLLLLLRKVRARTTPLLPRYYTNY